jgi:hypothetical protein
MIKLSFIIDTLKKFSKLTDEQYKKVLNDYSKLQELEQNNLLDLFYKARPDKTENELKELSEFQNTVIDYSSKSINPKVIKFLNEHGKKGISDFLMGISNEAIKSEIINADELFQFMNDDNLLKLRFVDLVRMYYERVKHSDVSLIRFIDDYTEYEKLYDEYEEAFINFKFIPADRNTLLRKLKSKVSVDLFVILDQINELGSIKSDLPLETVPKTNIQQAISLRNSDVFDFVLKEE